MLINDTRPLGTEPQLESDLLERELENGVIVEQDAIVQAHVVRLFGGLMIAATPASDASNQCDLGTRRHQGRQKT